jgi:hypothetical protein
MVRKELEKFYKKDQNVLRTYSGRIGEIGLSRYKNGYRVLICDVCLATGEWISDHIWLCFEVMPYNMGLNIGDPVQFAGRVQAYKKRSGAMDFGIEAVFESIRRCDQTIILPVLD